MTGVMPGGNVSTCAALLIVTHYFGHGSATADSSCGEFAQFDLVAHFLEACSKSFNLLLLFGYDRSLFP